MKERGGARLKTFVTLVILAALIFTAIKVIPSYFANYQLQDSMKEEAQFAGPSKKSEDNIRDDVWKKMQELGIPGHKEDIHVVVSGSDTTITLDYTVPIDLKLFQFNLDFHPHADNHTI
jgi:hypothetical protein